MTYDIAIIGGGIVGLATAHEILQRVPEKKVLVLEKEEELAFHQTGRNSGVIHSGIYYKPGSFKARLCREGYQALVRFCEEHGIPFDICGKLIIAVSESQLQPLSRLKERAKANGLRDCRQIGREEIREIEPHAAGISALHVPETGIVDYRRVCAILADLIRARGGSIRLGTKVEGMKDEFSSPGRSAKKRLVTPKGDFFVDFIVNCTGLHCDRTARMDKLKPPGAIIPFRGEYYKLAPPAITLVKNLIYPVPDPAFPFLGVHFTRMIDGTVECGPNAVLAFKREGYRKSDFNAKDAMEILTYPGFRKLAVKYWRMGMMEFYRSFSKRAFTRELSKLVPEIGEEMLLPAESGVRAQAIAPNGTLVDDFLFMEGRNSLHVLNAPSPAATASLAIAREIADRCPLEVG